MMESRSYPPTHGRPASQTSHGTYSPESQLGLIGMTSGVQVTHDDTSRSESGVGTSMFSDSTPKASNADIVKERFARRRVTQTVESTQVTRGGSMDGGSVRGFARAVNTVTSVDVPKKIDYCPMCNFQLIQQDLGEKPAHGATSVVLCHSNSSSFRSNFRPGSFSSSLFGSYVEDEVSMGEFHSFVSKFQSHAKGTLLPEAANLTESANYPGCSFMFPIQVAIEGLIGCDKVCKKAEPNSEPRDDASVTTKGTRTEQESILYGFGDRMLPPYCSHCQAFIASESRNEMEQEQMLLNLASWLASGSQDENDPEIQLNESKEHREKPARGSITVILDNKAAAQRRVASNLYEPADQLSTSNNVYNEHRMNVPRDTRSPSRIGPPIHEQRPQWETMWNGNFPEGKAVYDERVSRPRDAPQMQTTGALQKEHFTGPIDKVKAFHPNQYPQTEYNDHETGQDGIIVDWDEHVPSIEAADDPVTSTDERTILPPETPRRLVPSHGDDIKHQESDYFARGESLHRPISQMETRIEQTSTDEQRGPNSTRGRTLTATSEREIAPVVAGDVEDSVPDIVIARCSTIDEEMMIIGDYEEKRQIATKAIGKRLMEGFILTQVQCSHCQMPMMEKSGRHECVVCPLVAKKAKKRAVQKRVHFQLHTKDPQLATNDARRGDELISAKVDAGEMLPPPQQDRPEIELEFTVVATISNDVADENEQFATVLSIEESAPHEIEESITWSIEECGTGLSRARRPNEENIPPNGTKERLTWSSEESVAEPPPEIEPINENMVPHGTNDGFNWSNEESGDGPSPERQPIHEDRSPRSEGETEPTVVDDPTYSLFAHDLGSREFNWIGENDNHASAYQEVDGRKGDDNNVASHEVYRRLLQGWFLTDVNCSGCFAPLMQSPENTTTVCVFCESSSDEPVSIGWSDQPECGSPKKLSPLGNDMDDQLLSNSGTRNSLCHEERIDQYSGREASRTPSPEMRPNSPGKIRYLAIPDDVDWDDDDAILRVLAAARKSSPWRRIPGHQQSGTLVDEGVSDKNDLLERQIGQNNDRRPEVSRAETQRFRSASDQIATVGYISNASEWEKPGIGMDRSCNVWLDELDRQHSASVNEAQGSPTSKFYSDPGHKGGRDLNDEGTKSFGEMSTLMGRVATSTSTEMNSHHQHASTRVTNLQSPAVSPCKPSRKVFDLMSGGKRVRNQLEPEMTIRGETAVSKPDPSGTRNDIPLPASASSSSFHTPVLLSSRSQGGQSFSVGQCDSSDRQTLAKGQSEPDDVKMHAKDFDLVLNFEQDSDPSPSNSQTDFKGRNRSWDSRLFRSISGLTYGRGAADIELSSSRDRLSFHPPPSEKDMLNGFEHGLKLLEADDSDSEYNHRKGYAKNYSTFPCRACGKRTKRDHDSDDECCVDRNCSLFLIPSRAVDSFSIEATWDDVTVSALGDDETQDMQILDFETQLEGLGLSSPTEPVARTRWSQSSWRQSGHNDENRPSRRDSDYGFSSEELSSRIPPFTHAGTHHPRERRASSYSSLPSFEECKSAGSYGSVESIRTGTTDTANGIEARVKDAKIVPTDKYKEMEDDMDMAKLLQRLASAARAIKDLEISVQEAEGSQASVSPRRRQSGHPPTSSRYW